MKIDLGDEYVAIKYIGDKDNYYFSRFGKPFLCKVGHIYIKDKYTGQRLAKKFPQFFQLVEDVNKLVHEYIATFYIRANVLELTEEEIEKADRKTLISLAIKMGIENPFKMQTENLRRKVLNVLKDFKELRDILQEEKQELAEELPVDMAVDDLKDVVDEMDKRVSAKSKEKEEIEPEEEQKEEQEEQNKEVEDGDNNTEQEA